MTNAKVIAVPHFSVFLHGSSPHSYPPPLPFLLYHSAMLQYTPTYDLTGSSPPTSEDTLIAWHHSQAVPTAFPNHHLLTRLEVRVSIPYPHCSSMKKSYPSRIYAIWQNLLVFIVLSSLTTSQALQFYAHGSDFLFILTIDITLAEFQVYTQKLSDPLEASLTFYLHLNYLL